MPSFHSSPTIPLSLRGGGSSRQRSSSSPVALVRSVLASRRGVVLLAELGAFLCLGWFVLGWATGSVDPYLDSLAVAADRFDAASSLGNDTNPYRGTFASVSCPADGCSYSRFETDFERILNASAMAGVDGQLPLIDQNRGRYENKGIVFNPALLRMPPGSRYELIVLARGPSSVETGDVFRQRRTIIGYFANVERGTDIVQQADALMFDMQTEPSAGCEYPWNTFPGPEDPRALWSPEGVPLLVVGMDTARPESCRTMGVMDLRTLWLGLRDELERIAWPTAEESRKTAEQLDQGTEVWFDGVGAREKNWAALFAPFQSTVFAGTLPLPSFHYEVWPQTLLFPNTSIETPAGNLLPYEKFVSPTPDGPSELKTCMERIQDADDFKQIGFKLGDHHATPFHALTLHERSKGQRRRTDSNTVLVGLVHGKSFDMDRPSMYWYDRYVVVLNATAPHRPIAVSPYLNISSLEQDRFYFTQSITFLPLHAPITPPPSPPPFPLNLFIPAPAPVSAPAPSALSDGYLDDDVLIGMGEADGLMGAVRMNVRHMLAGARGCGGDDDDAFQTLVQGDDV